MVDLIADKTLKPLAEERLRAFEAGAQMLSTERRQKTDRMAALARLDPAEAVLRLKALDPAMGSGHFLVSTVDFLSDYIAELIDYVLPACRRGWTGLSIAAGGPNRRNPAGEGNWIIDVAQLMD